jgi:hypothetical protein
MTKNDLYVSLNSLLYHKKSVFSFISFLMPIIQWARKVYAAAAEK